MASRRTRIKGIANIPQRRKTLNTSCEENAKSSISENGKAEEPNLNVNHVNTVESCEEKFDNPVEKNNGNAENIVEKHEFNDTEQTIEKEIIQNESLEENIPAKPALPNRRSFIKPTVSLNAINRKSKDTELLKSPDYGTAVNNKDKIVILDEFITYSDQNQPVVISSNKVESPSTPISSKLPEPSYRSNLEKDPKRIIPSSPLSTPDLEYPILPPSPNKINRSRIKAVPKLGQRNATYSASESEDESRRNYRHRNDSVCSSASGFLDSSSISECLSPQKPKEYNSVIQRKCRRTEQSRKLAEARREFYSKFGNNTPDRQKLTMMDLIFYNPVTNPMSNVGKKRKNSVSSTTQESKIEEEIVDDPKKSVSDEENEIPAPQIKIGPQGEIIVDEQSLVIENKKIKKNREELEKSELINGDFETGYGIYKRAKRSKDWSKKETLKFYKALNTIGTDFTLMAELFPRRSRRELKMKFKKEERVNKSLIDKAIMQPCGFDFNDFKHEVEMEEKELQELEKQKEREKQMKEDAKKRKTVITSKKEPPKKIQRVLSEEEKDDTVKQTKVKDGLHIFTVLSDTDADVSEVDSDEETVDNSLIQSIQKPTRSGRVPKILDRYKAAEANKESTAKPGELIVVASKGENGNPVYSVCMVTEENEKKQIKNNVNNLESFLNENGNGITALFKLSATEIPENHQNNTMEENITIPADEDTK